MFIWRRDTLDLSNRKIAELTGLDRRAVGAVFRGTAPYKVVYQVAQLLGLDWAMVHSFALIEDDYRLAVRRGAQFIAPQATTDNSGIPAI